MKLTRCNMGAEPVYDFWRKVAYLYIRKLLFDVIFLLKAPPVMIRSKNPFVILMASGKVG